MTWNIIFTKKAQKQIKRLDHNTQSRFKKAISEKLMTNPLAYLEPLVGEFGGFYKFRIGNYRLICKKQREHLIIIVVALGHRRDIYQ